MWEGVGGDNRGKGRGEEKRRGEIQRSRRNEIKGTRKVQIRDFFLLRGDYLRGGEVSNPRSQQKSSGSK